MDDQQTQQQPPQQQAPPQEPQWAPPPQQPSGWGTPTGPAPAERPMGVTLAAIYLIVMGALASLVGACGSILGGAIGGLELPEMPGFGGVLGGAIVFIGIVILVIGVLHIVGGAGILGGRNWGRWIGIVVSVIAVIFGVLGLIGSLGQPGMEASGTVFNLVFTVLYALTAWVLLKSSAYFAYRR